MPPTDLPNARCIARILLCLIVPSCVAFPDAAPLAAAERPSPSAPLSSPLYRAVDALWAAGLIPSPHLGARPLGEKRLRDLIAEARRREPLRTDRVLRAAGLVRAMAGERPVAPGRAGVKMAGPERTREPRVPAPDIHDENDRLAPVGPWQFRLVGAEVDSGRGLRSFSSGGFVDDGVAGEVEFGWSDAFLDRGLAQLRLRARASRVSTQGRLLTGTLRWSLGSIDLTLGRDAMWLGPGRVGSLLLSNEAPPFDQVRISPRRPAILPWWFRALGTTSYQVAFGRLAEKRRDYDNPLLWAARFSAAPTGWLELGATRAVLFGGDGRTGRLKASDLVEILLGLNENLYHERDPSDSDQIAAVDATVALSFLSFIPGVEGARIGLEYAGEDNLGPGLLPTAVGHTIGGEIITRVCDVRLEVAETVDDGILWYRHRIFSDGYRYRGRFLGHAMGGDSRQGVLEIVAPIGASGALGACYEERRHGGVFGPERTEIRRTAGFSVSGGAGTWSLRYCWRSTFGPLSDEEARGERRSIEATYEPIL